VAVAVFGFFDPFVGDVGGVDFGVGSLACDGGGYVGGSGADVEEFAVRWE